MKNIEASVGTYVQVMTKAVAEHLGGVEVTAFLGHIFSTSLNFQMLMWQLVMTEAVYPPTMTREHLCRKTEMLQLFAEVIPILAPCSIRPPPIPTTDLTPLAPQNICGASVGEPSLPTTPSSGGMQPTTPLSSQQRLQSRVGAKLMSCIPPPIIGVWEGVNKAVVHVAPSGMSSNPAIQ